MHFETKIRKIVENYVDANNILALAKRNVMTRWSKQTIDLEVDSPDRDWYWGVECKSTTVKKTPVILYFSNTFHPGQYENLCTFFEKSGRRGYLAVEVGFNKNNRGEMSHPKKRKTFIIDWNEVVKVYDAGEKSFRFLCKDSSDDIPYRVLKKIDSREYNVQEAFGIGNEK